MPASRPSREAGGHPAARSLAALVLALATSAGCATATRLHTHPEGATVWVNGELIGKTPVVYENDPGLPRRYHVQLYKPGYAPLDFYLDAKLSWLWGYVGAVTLVPYLWAWSLGRDYVFALEAERTPPAAEPPDAPADPPVLLERPPDAGSGPDGEPAAELPGGG